MIDALQQRPSSYIDGRFIPLEGDQLVSTDPADPERVTWQGTPPVEHVDLAIAAARRALPDWSAKSLDDRVELLQRWKQAVTAQFERIAGAITDEMGKTLAESRAEAKLLAGKVDITLDDMSIGRVTPYDVAVTDTRSGRCRFKPYGVMAVLGPFNFPGPMA